MWLRGSGFQRETCPWWCLPHSVGCYMDMLWWCQWRCPTTLLKCGQHNKHETGKISSLVNQWRWNYGRVSVTKEVLAWSLSWVRCLMTHSNTHSTGNLIMEQTATSFFEPSASLATRAIAVSDSYPPPLCIIKRKQG